jgi:adenine-specific DNA-methyltransferase
LRAAQFGISRHEQSTNMPEIVVAKSENQLPTLMGSDYALWQGDTEVLLAALPAKPFIDLVVTSPPYNLGKSYEKKAALKDYMVWQERIIDLIIPRLAQTGSICWQVGIRVSP